MFTTPVSVEWEWNHTHHRSQVPLPAHTATRRTSPVVCRPSRPAAYLS